MLLTARAASVFESLLLLFTLGLGLVYRAVAVHYNRRQLHKYACSSEVSIA
jgi:hypothetical protein